MRSIYSFLLYLLTPFLLLRLFWKSRKLPPYRQRLSERFALNRDLKGPVDVWVHAVSLGEVIAATPLIEAMLSKGWKVLVTTMTPTGSERVQKQFKERVAHQYLPYDLPSVQRRFFNRFKPKVGLIMETELWPNTIFQAAEAKIPLILANARMSEISARGYERLSFFFKEVLNQFTAILTQGDDDAKRFIKIGASESRVQRIGNMKFDLQIKNNWDEAFDSLKQRWGKSRPVLIVASTHDNEEAQILDQLKTMQEGIPGLMLLIAPRHPERFQSVYEQSQQRGFKTALRSDPSTLSEDSEVLVLDSLGELMSWYAQSDYAFVGGSFVPVGGHNVLEPIAVGIPVFSGPEVHNFKSIVAELEKAQGLQIVPDANALTQALIQLEQDTEKKEQQIKAAKKIFNKNKGAVNYCLKAVEAVML